MEVQVEKTGSYLCKVSVSIPAGEVDSAFDKAYRKVSKAAQLPGFRPGKVPRNLIERQFSSQILQEVQNELVEETLFRAMDEKNVAAVNMPRLTLGQLIRGTEFSYTAEVECRPEITLQKYDGLAAPALDNAVAAEAVTEELESMRKQNAQMVPVLLRDQVETGDVVLLDYEGFVDGVPFDGGKAENALVEIGGDGYIPGFSEGLLGARVPGERDVPVTFPTDYNAQELAGKAATFKMQLKELKARELPKLDDEFAKDMGEENLAALQDKITTTLKERKEREAESTRRKAVLKSLVDANPFEVPPSMVESQADRIVAGAHARVERMVGQKLQLNAEQMASLRDNSKEDAEFQVRSGLLLLEVAKAANIEVESDDLEAEIDKMADQAGEHAERMRAFYDDGARRDELRFRLLEDKVVGYLLEHAVVSESAA